LRGVYFSGASIRHATLAGADLRGSDFSNVNRSYRAPRRNSTSH
jgi:uncharacterized protein YjbI with pentapeptide repeats